MAIERNIPENIKDFEPALIGPFTKRQILCLAGAVGLGLAIVFLTSSFLSLDIRMFLVVLVASPLILVGWYKPYGLPFEKFAKVVLNSMILAPKHRKYKSERLIESESALAKDNVRNQNAKKRKKKKGEVDPSLRSFK